MTHSDAIAGEMVEKYLLGDLSAAERDAFEEHYFECRECAEEVDLTSRLIEEIRTQTRSLGPGSRKPSLVPPPPKRSRLTWAPLAMAASLACVVGYQNLVQLPALRTLARGPILQSAPLALRMGERSETAATVAQRDDGKPLLLQLDIPVEERFTGYEVILQGPVSATFAVSPAQAADPVVVNFGAAPPASGSYTIVVRGRPATGDLVTLQQRSFRVE